MKKYFLFSLLLLISLPAAQATVNFYIVKVEPVNLEPGEVALMNITIKNFGSDYATNFRAIFDPYAKSPLMPVGAQKIFLSKKVEKGFPTTYFGNVLQGREVTLSLPVTVSRNAAFGNYLIPVELLYRNPEQQSLKDTVYFGVKIAGTAEINIGGLNTSPSRVYQDEDFTLYLNLENSGTGNAKNIKLNLELPQGISGQKTVELGTVDREGKTRAIFNLKSSSNISTGSHRAYAILNYTEENSVKRQVKLPFDVFISQRGKIDMEIAGLDTSPKSLYPGESFTLSIQIQNVGKQDATAVKVDISPESSITGELTSYLGNLKQDDTSTAIFDLQVEPSAHEGNIKVPMKIIYKDETGRIGEVTKEVYLNVSSGQSGTSKVYLIIVGLVVIGALFLWRRRRKTTEEEI